MSVANNRLTLSLNSQVSTVECLKTQAYSFSSLAHVSNPVPYNLPQGLKGALFSVGLPYTCKEGISFHVSERLPRVDMLYLPSM